MIRTMAVLTGALVVGCAGPKQLQLGAMSLLEMAVAEQKAALEQFQDETVGRVRAGVQGGIAQVGQAVSEVGATTWAIDRKADEIASAVVALRDTPKRVVAPAKKAAASGADRAVRAVETAASRWSESGERLQRDLQAKMDQQLTLMNDLVTRNQQAVDAMVDKQRNTSAVVPITATGGGLLTLLLLWFGWWLRGKFGG